MSTSWLKVRASSPAALLADVAVERNPHLNGDQSLGPRDCFYECDAWCVARQSETEAGIELEMVLSNHESMPRAAIYSTSTRLMDAAEPDANAFLWHAGSFWRVDSLACDGPWHNEYPFAVTPDSTVASYAERQAARMAGQLIADGVSLGSLLEIWAPLAEYPSTGCLKQVCKAPLLQQDAPSLVQLRQALERILGRGRHPYLANPPGRAARNLLSAITTHWLSTPSSPPWKISPSPRFLVEVRVALAQFGITKLEFQQEEQVLLQQALAIIWLQKVKDWPSVAPLLIQHGITTLQDVLQSIRSRVPRERPGVAGTSDGTQWNSDLMADPATAWQVA